MVSLVIWDFNGTIADDIALSFDSINAILRKRNLPILQNIDEYRKKFCFPIEKYYQNIGLDFSKEPYKIPADEWVSGYLNGMDTVALTDGVRETIEKINKKGVPQIVLSASERKMLIHQLDLFRLTEYFDEVLGTGDVYGGGKVDMAREWVKNKRTGILENAVLIGDTDHDFATAAAIGCSCILYSGGHMSKETLGALGVPIVDDIRRVCDYVLDK